MMYTAVGSEENMQWPKWAENFIARYMAWSEIKSKDDIEFSNMGRFISEETIPLSEFKEIITATYSSEGLKGMETHFIFGWSGPAEKEKFIARFEN